jgi:hypothetical protein
LQQICCNDGSMKITDPHESDVHRTIREFDGECEATTRRYLTVAGEIVNHQRRYGGSQESVYRIEGTAAGNWSHQGEYCDDYARNLALSHPRYYVVARSGSGNTPWQVASQMAPAVPDRYERAVCLRDATDRAVPVIAAVLAFAVQAGGVTWDTSETLTAAARRLAYDTADKIFAEPNPWRPKPQDVLNGILELLGQPPAPGSASAIAQAYLNKRGSLKESLAQHGIKWGGKLLSSKDAAYQAGRAWSTWRADVARGTAPGPDETEPPRWRNITVELWIIAQDPSTFEESPQRRKAPRVR